LLKKERKNIKPEYMGIEGVYKVTFPLPFDLDHVNCYLVKGDEGWSIIDAGMNIPPTHEGWTRSIEELGIKWEDIGSIYITHYHPDHYGAAGWLQERSGAPVYMSARDLFDIQAIWQADFETMSNMNDFYLVHGVPQKLLHQIADNLVKTSLDIFPVLPRINTVKEGDTVMLGNLCVKVVHTPGHADGHICFFCPDTNTLFSGDHLLPEITSNVGLWPGGEPNPLKDFFSSLHKIGRYNIDLVLPAHGEPFRGAGTRIEELFQHHRERLDLMAQYAGKGQTAFAICRMIFGSDLSLHNFRFAIAETIAHMVFLESEGRIEVVENSDAITYRAVV
jgi:glyoxylase-like metal-dependent hydrolase (beta-lactamase superfamily II)